MSATENKDLQSGSNIYPCVTIRDAIFCPSNFDKQSIILEGNIVLHEESIQRLDIADNGAKLIVDISNASINGTVEVGRNIAVIGVLKRKQRRLFMTAENINVVS